MKNLKRALSLALASIMTLGLMVTGVGAASFDDFSDKDKIVNQEAVSILNTLNIINGKDDGSYDPTGIVTRAEMAKMICVVLNGGKDPQLGTVSSATYTDTAASWAAGYIEYCTQLKIVAGDGTGKFNPTNTVTGTEAAKMLLVALGYDSGIEGFTGGQWATAVNVAANQNKLYNGLNINPSEGLSRDNAAQMVYNAINAREVQYGYTLTTNSGEISSVTKRDFYSDERTLLSDKFGAVRVEGVVTANQETTSTFEGKTRLTITNDEELKTLGYDLAAGNQTFYTNTTAEMLGHAVILYVKPSVTSKTDGLKATVLGEAIDAGTNTIVDTTAYFADGISDYMKDKDIKIAANTQVFVNGSETTNSAGPDGEPTDGVAEVGKLDDNNSGKGITGWKTIFIDNDGDGVTEVVHQIRAYFGKVTRYTTKDDGGLTIDTAVASTKDLKSDKIVGFEDVELNDYVTYYFMGGKVYVKEAETVTGAIDSFKANATDEKANIEVDGTTYKFGSTTQQYNGDSKLSQLPTTYCANTYVGKDITLYLDMYGYVVAASKVNAIPDYCYVANAASNDNATGYDGAVTAYVVLPDGTTGSYQVKNLKNGTYDDSPTGVDTSYTANNGKVVKQAIYEYYLNSDGEIELTWPTAAVKNSTDTQDVKFESGKSTVTLSDSQSTYADNDTLFYVVTRNASKGIKSVDVYNGKDKAASVDYAATSAKGTQATALLSTTKTNVADIVVFDTINTTSANVLYLYQYVKSSGDYTIYNAVIDGELVEGITVDSKNVNLADAPYTYTISSKDYYKLTANPSTTIEGYVTLADSRTAVIEQINGLGSQEVKLTSSTSMAEIDGGDTIITNTLNEKDIVTVVYDSTSKEAKGVYVTERYSVDNANIVGLADSATYIEKSVTSGYNYNVENGATVANILGEVATSKDASSVYMTLTEPTKDNIGDNKMADGATVSTDCWIVVVAKDGSSWSSYKCDTIATVTPAP